MKTKLILIAFFLTSWFCSQAQIFEKDGFSYRIINQSHVEFRGLATNIYLLPETTETLIIPERVSYDNVEYVVTGIGKNAFSRLRAYKSIDLPGSLTYIDQDAFFCSAFENVILPENIISIGDGAFFGSAITSIYIPDKVRLLGNKVFGYCGNLTDVTFGSKSILATIPRGCFESCNKIKKIEIPEWVREIQMEAFRGCSNLQEISSSGYGYLDNIGSYCFSECSSLKNVNLHMLGSIGTGAFSHCDNLKYIRLDTPDIGYDVFSGTNLNFLCLNDTWGLPRSPESILGDSKQAERTVLALPKGISEDYIESIPDLLQTRTCVTFESDIVDQFSVMPESYIVEQYFETLITPNYPEDFYDVRTDYVLFPRKNTCMYIAWKSDRTDLEVSVNSVIVPEKDIQKIDLPDNEQLNIFLTPTLSSNTTVYVGPKGTGVESTTVDYSENFDLYDINGSVVYRNIDENSLRNLPKGMYIKKTQTGTSKIIL